MMKEECLSKEKLWEVSPGNGYCGLFVPSDVMKKLMRLSNKFEQNVRDILKDNQTRLLVSDWTLYNEEDENGKILHQEIIKFCSPKEWDSVQSRIEVFKIIPPVSVDVYLCDRETAKIFAKEIYEEKLRGNKRTHKHKRKEMNYDKNNNIIQKRPNKSGQSHK